MPPGALWLRQHQMPASCRHMKHSFLSKWSCAWMAWDLQYVRFKPCTIGSSSNVDAPPFDLRFLQLRCADGFRVTHQAEACSMNQSCTAENPKRNQALQEDPPSRTNAKRLKKFTKMQKNSKRDKCANEAKEELKRRSR